jgi:hypothetical protein
LPGICGTILTARGHIDEIDQLRAQLTSPDDDSHTVAAAPPIDPELFEGLKTFKDVPIPDLPRDGNKD